VVIDPGQGGWETGAVNSAGLKEKDLTLAAANTLAQLLKAKFGFKVALTRSGDYYLSQGKRIEIANTAKGGAPADLFIGIHVNNAFSPAAAGPRCLTLTYQRQDGVPRGIRLSESTPMIYPLYRLSDKWSPASYQLGDFITTALQE